MKNIIIALVLLLCAPAFAGGLNSTSVSQAGFDNLSESQKADILKQIAANQEGDKSVAAAVSSPQKVNEWLDIGTKIGQMFGGAAKEVGIAVNDFVKTPVGMWTLALIVWKFMGGVIVHFAGGLVVLTIGMSMITYILLRGRQVEITYSDDKTDLLGRARRLKYERSSMSDDDKTIGLLCTAVTIAVTLICIFTY